MLIVLLGSAAMLPVWVESWQLWTSDPLRSIGMIFPALSLIGVVAAWRRGGWVQEGTWWGLPLSLAAIAGASLFSAPMLLLFFFGARVRLLHPGMALFCYGVGAVLLFGGRPLLRQAIAPLCLLLLLDPVPHFFNRMLDMPLQVLSAGTSRAFAHRLGLRPTGVQLQMMFAPDFGMFIVPGCNGVRGAVTFGYLALLLGYVRNLPARMIAAFTAAAVLMGYLFNLIRLCTLVLYYRAGLALPSIRSYGMQVDYVIGCTLFLVATLGTGFAITSYQHTHSIPARRPAVSPAARIPSQSIWFRSSVLLASAMLFFLPQAHSIRGSFRPPLSAAQTLRQFPATVGAYTLTHTWEERDATGSLMFLFGDYLKQSTGERLTLGIYLASEDHFVFLSKLTQGVRPDLQDSFHAALISAEPIHFFLSFYRESNLRTLDAETSCRLNVCDGNLSGEIGKVGLIGPHLADLLVAPAGRRVPLLLRRTTTDSTLPDAAFRTQFEQSVREFTRSLNIKPLLGAQN